MRKVIVVFNYWPKFSKNCCHFDLNQPTMNSSLTVNVIDEKVSKKKVIVPSKIDEFIVIVVIL